MLIRSAAVPLFAHYVLRKNAVGRGAWGGGGSPQLSLRALLAEPYQALWAAEFETTELMIAPQFAQGFSCRC
jgi:hypothetical protein